MMIFMAASEAPQNPTDRLAASAAAAAAATLAR